MGLTGARRSLASFGPILALGGIIMGRMKSMTLGMGKNRAGPALALALAAALLVLGGAAVQAQDERIVGLERQSDLTVTIYNQDLALISETRGVAFEAGRNRLALLGVSRLLRPETVILSGPGLSLFEQSYDADVLSPARLLERALGAPVWVKRVNPADGSLDYREAELVSLSGPLVRVEGRLETVPLDKLAFAPQAEGLRDQATLIAVLGSDAAGERSLGLAYLTGGLSWQADYVARLDAAEETLDLTGLVTLRNDSGTDYPAARLRLVAGDINQVRPTLMAKAEAMDVRGAAVAMAAPPQMVEQAIGEQHLYSLDQPVDIPQRVTKQVSLLSAQGLAVTKEYRFEALIGAHGGPEEIGPVKAQVRLEFENDEAAGLGRPLPRGVIRVYQDTGEATPPVFIGEDQIAHTAKGGTLRLTTGRAFDVTGKALRTVFERISNKTYETGQRIELRNAKDQPVTVKVVGQMPQGWRMMQESLPHEPETANRIVWTLDVPAGGEARFDYRVRVTRP